MRTAAGWDERLRVVDVDAASIRTERRRKPIIFARADILEIQVSRVAPGKTAALAAGIYFGALIEKNGC